MFAGGHEGREHGLLEFGEHDPAGFSRQGLRRMDRAFQQFRQQSALRPVEIKFVIEHELAASAAPRSG
jgi:hypothetical protein